VENGVFILPPPCDLAASSTDEPLLAVDRSVARNSATVSLPFIGGAENRLASVTVESLLTERPSRFNPLMIVGPTGTGKTHLARGLAECWSAHHGESAVSVQFFTASDFAAELQAAIAAEKRSEFQNRIRSASLLVIDNLTQLQSRRSAQLDLIYSLDCVIDCGGQVVVTSSTSPERIAGLATDLRSRLAAGLTLPLVLPGAAARLALIERMAELRSIPITPSAARALADCPGAAAPELLGALLDLDMHSRLTLDADSDESERGKISGRALAFGAAAQAPQLVERTIDARAVRQFLAVRRSKLQPSLRSIARQAAKYFGLRVAELLSPSRRRAVVHARGIAMYLGRQLSSKSLEQLGKHFGGRDHTTVLHSYRLIESRLRSDPATRRAVADIRKSLAHV
jgi:chromosomal replication initiator protein